jgi:hypothetical protein
VRELDAKSLVKHVAQEQAGRRAQRGDKERERTEIAGPVRTASEDRGENATAELRARRADEYGNG